MVTNTYHSSLQGFILISIFYSSKTVNRVNEVSALRRTYLLVCGVNSKHVLVRNVAAETTSTTAVKHTVEVNNVITNAVRVSGIAT